MITFINDPMPVLVDIAQMVLPEGVEIEVQYHPHLGFLKAGSITIDGLRWNHMLIDISAKLPFYKVPSVFAHELAHAIRGPEWGHDEEWDRIYTWIQTTYHERIREIAEARKKERT